MIRRCPECEEDVEVEDPPGDAEVCCPTCAGRWFPGNSDPHAGWRVPAGGPSRWAQVLARYEDGEAHHEFMGFCHQARALEYAARRYRRVLARSDGDEQRAREGLLRLSALARGEAIPEGPGGTETLGLGGWLLVVLAAVVVGFSAWLLGGWVG